jgi:threonine dehydratase
LNAPTIHQVREARRRIAGDLPATPLLRLEEAATNARIHLKLENLQPIGSFKLRGALNKIGSLDAAQLAHGVYTASAGNMAQGVAWAARARSVPATVVVPDTAPRAKLDAISRLGASIVSVPYEEWWETMRAHRRDGLQGAFVHPFADPLVMAGNGTIALEILEQLPEVEGILVPWGGGGLACGIAAAFAAIAPRVRVYACEVDGAAPLDASMQAGRPVTIENARTFVDGIGGRGVFPEMWPLARELLAGNLTVTVDEVSDAVRLIAVRSRVIAEGAGAVGLAAARRWVTRITPTPGVVVCIVSGGNIDPSTLASILSGSTP